MVRFMIAVLLTAVAVVGCESTDKQRAQQAISDVSISAAVQARLTGDRDSNFTLVRVESDRGVVRLSGVVTSAQQRKRAEELSRQVKGVTSVHNSLRVQHEPTKTGKLGE